MVKILFQRGGRTVKAFHASRLRCGISVTFFIDATGSHPSNFYGIYRRHFGQAILTLHHPRDA